MKFNSDADRMAAIQKACEAAGVAFGKMKLAEVMLSETIKSYVEAGTTVSVNGTATGEAPAAPAKQAEAATQTVTAQAEAKTEAPKPRGRPRKEAPAVAPVASAAPAQVAPVESSDEMSESVEDEPCSYEALFEDMKAAAVRLGTKQPIFDKMKELYGVDKSSMLPPDRYAEFRKIVRAM